MDEDILPILLGVVLGLYMGFIITLVCTKPTEPENGCIVHDNTIYCKEVSE